jgi:hypothetical protein
MASTNLINVWLWSETLEPCNERNRKNCCRSPSSFFGSSIYQRMLVWVVEKGH